MSVFDQYPDFITTDGRQYRTIPNSYKISNQLQTARHQTLLPLELVKGRTILDLGCCVGATGAWVLHHGAKKYTGIDLDQEFVTQSNTNLAKYFSEDKWNVIQSSIEDFLANNNKKYDIIVASGVIYAFINYHWFVKQLAAISGTVIIESQHPLYDWYRMLPQCLPEDMRDSFSEHFDPTALFENFPVSMIKPSTMVKGQNNEHYEGGWGSFPSLKTLEMLFNNENFIVDWSAYGKLKTLLPEIYGPLRYAGVFHRRRETKKYPTVLDLAV